MSTVTTSLFKAITDELITYDAKTHKVFKGGQRLNGIIRYSPAEYMGVIIDDKKIYRFTIAPDGMVSMDIRLSEHLIMINTENSMRIFTASSVLLEYPLVKKFKHPISDSPFWVNVFNRKYSL